MSKFNQILDYWRHLIIFKLHELEDGNLIIIHTMKSTFKYFNDFSNKSSLTSVNSI